MVLRSTNNKESAVTAFATSYRTETVLGHEIFYRTAGDPERPTLVLLHGFPASSFMYRELIAELADSYHLIAPDHLGFGRSATPSTREFEYTFDALAVITTELLDRLGLERFALYMQDYGAPIGFRIATQQPGRITALITQNGNAYLDGLTPFWEPLLAYAADGVTNAEPVRASLEPAGQRWVYTHGVPAERLDGVSPDTWTLDQAGLERPGNKEIQLALFRDYRFNLELYPKFQEYFRTHQPPTLAVWGANDEIFGPDGARAFARDLPDAEIHLLDAGHYALESHGGEIAELVRSFLRRVL
jgi:pimeloyl-ACP methyl ester carboxylesterase